jgi:valyl-tRNA synthetase
MNACTNAENIDLYAVHAPVNKWIVSEYNTAIAKTTAAIDSYRFNEAADALYHFIWHSYCDWYVELIKPSLSDENSTIASEIKATASTILAGTLRLLHPFMPYLTEELNQKIFQSDDMLIAAGWPQATSGSDSEAVNDIQFLISLITEIRYIRSEMNVPLSAKPVLQARGMTAAQAAVTQSQSAALMRLARLSGVSIVDQFAKGTARGSVDGADIGLPLADILDLDAEAARLKKDIGGVEIEIKKISGKLDNPNFLAKAPDDVVAENRRRLEDEQIKLDGLTAALRRLA